MTLKERLDAVWNTGEIAFPCHLVIWSEKKENYTKFSEFELYFKKGLRLDLHRKKTAKK